MKGWPILFVVCVSFAFQGGCGAESSDATKSSKLNEEPQADLFIDQGLCRVDTMPAPTEDCDTGRTCPSGLCISDMHGQRCATSCGSGSPCGNNETCVRGFDLDGAVRGSFCARQLSDAEKACICKSLTAVGCGVQNLGTCEQARWDPRAIITPGDGPPRDPTLIYAEPPAVNWLAQCGCPIFADTARPCAAAAAQMGARAVHLRYLSPDGGNAFYIELTPERSTLGTYFAAAGWPFGYFGIQELRDGKKVAIFSVWDTHEQVQVLYVDPGARAQRFGNEGTGEQCLYDFNWQVGGTYRFYVTATPAPDGRTAFSGFLYVGDRWVQLATFSTVTGGTALAGTYSFVEDFMHPNVPAGIVRSALFGNGWIRSGESDWMPLCSAVFTATDGPLDNINLSVNDRFALATGGDTSHGSILLNEVANLPACLSGQPPGDLPREREQRPLDEPSRGGGCSTAGGAEQTELLPLLLVLIALGSLRSRLRPGSPKLDP